MLFTGVANGLVDGTIAATTPLGLKYVLKPFSLSQKRDQKILQILYLLTAQSFIMIFFDFI
jgi:hypothetical protein